jgi:putative inorganic carbon (HCO3(-)) transporter
MAPSRTGARLAAAAVAFVLPVLFSPSLASPAWTARAALLLLLVAIGLPRLVPLLRSEARRSAVAAIVFLGVATLATVLCPQPALSFFGLYNWGTGLLFVAALVGAWALGASVDGRGVDVVERALIAGVCVNAGVAVIQGAIVLDAAPFTRYEGRAAGLMSNPVHLATLSVAGLALLLPRVRTRPAVWGAATVFVAAAVELSGSRVALGLAIALAVFTIARGRREAVAGAALLGLGLVLGVGIGALGGATTGAGRVQAGGESVGTAARFHVWESARHAIADHPVLGSGPGRFRAATSPSRTLALVHAEGADRVFFDAHNVVVEYATTTGLLGLAALAVWLALAGRRAAGPLVGFALLIGAMHLVEPQFVGTTPLALLALGMAGRADVAPGRPVLTGATVVLGLIAVVAGSRLLVGDFDLDQAQLDFRAGPAHDAVRTLPPWPEPPELAAKIELYTSITTKSPAARAATLRWLAVAVQRDPTDPVAWSLQGESQLYFGDAAGAQHSFRHALQRDPWSVRALDGLANAALARGDTAAARGALSRSLRVDPNQPKVRAQLARL